MHGRQMASQITEQGVLFFLQHPRRWLRAACSGMHGHRRRGKSRSGAAECHCLCGGGLQRHIIISMPPALRLYTACLMRCGRRQWGNGCRFMQNRHRVGLTRQGAGCRRRNFSCCACILIVPLRLLRLGLHLHLQLRLSLMRRLRTCCKIALFFAPITPALQGCSQPNAQFFSKIKPRKPKRPRKAQHHQRHAKQSRAVKAQKLFTQRAQQKTQNPACRAR